VENGYERALTHGGTVPLVAVQENPTSPRVYRSGSELLRRGRAAASAAIETRLRLWLGGLSVLIVKAAQLRFHHLAVGGAWQATDEEELLRDFEFRQAPGEVLGELPRAEFRART